MNYIQENLESHASLDRNPLKALKETFVAAHDTLKVKKGIDSRISGTTAIAMLYRQVEGCSVIMLGSRSGFWRYLDTEWL